MHEKSKILLHYSMLLQGSLSNDTFEWINRYKYWNPYILPRLSKVKKNNFFFKHSIADNIRMRVYIYRCPRSSSCYLRRHECLGLLLRTDNETLRFNALEVPSITASFLLSASTTSLCKSMFFTLTLSNRLPHSIEHYLQHCVLHFSNQSGIISWI